MSAEAEAPRRWQHDIRSPKAGLAYICKNKVFCDVTLVVGGKKFKAHRLILMARSPRFCTLLNNNQDSAEIRITDVKPEAFEIMYNFIYTNKITTLKPKELVLEVHHAASLYGQRSLKEACEAIIVKWDISRETVVSVLQMSDVEFVRDRCWEFLIKNGRDVLTSDGILEASSDTLSDMFERGCFKGVPVIDIVNHVVRWASHLFPHQPDYFRVREHLLVPNGTSQKCLMSWIGFERLTIEQLGSVLNEYPKLFNDSEFRVFFQYLTAPADKKPTLPSWVEG